MAVSKRTRFEVLRRDDHTCRYCGQSAPDVKLHVDHVIPIALGGTDDPSNLAAACADCNIGKASTSPSELKVAEVSDATLRFIVLARQAWALKEGRVDEARAFEDEVSTFIDFPKPETWRHSVNRWYVLGTPLAIISDAAMKAAAKYDPYGNTDRFKYFCGIVWNQIREVNSAIEEHLDTSGQFISDDDLDALVEGLAATVPTLEKLLQSVVDGTYPEARRRHDATPPIEVQLCG